MCGIAGYLELSGRDADPRWLGEMLAAIRHRGPDDEGRFCEGPIAFGMRRLSVIDLQGGRQPIREPQTGRVITYNGECYNYRELREELRAQGAAFETASDTEVVLQAYCRRGLAGLGDLNGMFAFAVWDPAAGQLLLARDRVGIKPLYSWRGEWEGRPLLAWASELKALLRHPAVPRAVSPRGVSEFLKFGYTFPPTTVLEGIEKLAPGEYRIVRGADVEAGRFAAPPMETEPAEILRTPEESAQRVRDALDEAVRAQMVADVPVGAFLSGGIDSSGIVRLMKEHASGPVATFSIGFGEEDRFHDETGYAAQFARELGTDHHELRVQPDLLERLPAVTRFLDEPLADSSILVSYLISELARRHVTVALSGVGGDEVFAGYRRYLGYTLDRWFGGALGGLMRGPLRLLLRLAPKSRDSRWANLARLGTRYLQAGGSDALGRYVALVSTAADARLGLLFPGFEAGLPAAAIPADGQRDALETMIAFDFRGSLAEQLLNLTDRMSMAHSLEVRVPYLDEAVLRAARAVPSRHKIRRTRLRCVQKDALRGLLPDEILTRKKRGFGFPLGRWLREDHGGFMEEHLGGAAVKARGLFDPEQVRNLREEHGRREADHTDLLTGLLFFELWARNTLAL